MVPNVWKSHRPQKRPPPNFPPKKKDLTQDLLSTITRYPWILMKNHQNEKTHIHLSGLCRSKIIKLVCSIKFGKEPDRAAIKEKKSACPVPWRKTRDSHGIQYHKDSYSIYNHRYGKNQDVPNNPASVFINRYMFGVCRYIPRKSPPHWVYFSPTITRYAVCAPIPFQPPQPNLPPYPKLTISFSWHPWPMTWGHRCLPPPPLSGWNPETCSTLCRAIGQSFDHLAQQQVNLFPTIYI